MRDDTATYQIRVQGRLDAARLARYAAVSICYVNNETVITAVLPDQSALYGLVNRLRDLGAVLIALEKFTAEDAESAEEKEEKWDADERGLEGKNQC